MGSFECFLLVGPASKVHVTMIALPLHIQYLTEIQDIE